MQEQPAITNTKLLTPGQPAASKTELLTPQLPVATNTDQQTAVTQKPVAE